IKLGFLLFLRPVYLEMTGQEQSLANLLQQALRIKEDMVSSLRATQGSVLMEASARKLLENHVQTITHIVKQLSKDIQVLEAQIVQRDSVASGTTFAVQRLDHKNLSGFGDLRGRVARCDASIAQLSGDVKARELEIMKLQREVGEMRSGIELRLSDLELKEDVEVKLKAQVDLLSAHVEHVEKLLKKEHSADRLKRLESKFSSRIDNLEKSFTDELEQMRREYQSGFQSALDAIASLKHIGDSKAKLDKGELKKDIRQIQRKMAALPDA
ncbi:hypothetical protein NFI96_024561, partial [Prochilodus magdalenae]